MTILILNLESDVKEKENAEDDEITRMLQRIKSKKNFIILYSNLGSFFR